MKIGCVCGNVLRDQTDNIPFKARFVADQDFEDLGDEIQQKLAALLDQAPGAPAGDLKSSLGSVIWNALHAYTRSMYQCRNCGRLCVDDPDDPRALQWFRPGEDDDWKLLLASVKGAGSKVWRGNLVGHWDPSASRGEIWFDPPAGEKGGYEEFDDWDRLEKRYFDLLAVLQADPDAAGARLGISGEGEPGRDVHRWSPRDPSPRAG